jgi:predicted PolB exonuclease-like 3'-5' exonuclease
MKLGARKGRLPVQHLKKRSWTKKSGTLKPFINRFRRRKKRCFVSSIFRGRLMRPLKKCVILLKMTKTEGLNTESFVKTIHTTMMNGMMTSIMAILLLMMLLL